jgi:hypothetical protein
MKDTYSKEEVIEIIKAVQKDAEDSSYTYTKGRSDGYECWDVEEIGFHMNSPETFL